MSLAREWLSTLRSICAVECQSASAGARTNCTEAGKGTFTGKQPVCKRLQSGWYLLKDLLEKPSYRDRKQIVVASDGEGPVPSEHKGSRG